jgi:hypothetical protein
VCVSVCVTQIQKSTGNNGVPAPSIYLALHCTTVGMACILCERRHLLAYPCIHSHMTAIIPPPFPYPCAYCLRNAAGQSDRRGKAGMGWGYQESNLPQGSKDHSFTIAPRTPPGNAFIYNDYQKPGSLTLKLIGATGATRATVRRHHVRQLYILDRLCCFTFGDHAIALLF